MGSEGGGTVLEAFRDVPPQLERAAQLTITYEQVFAGIQERATSLGLRMWILKNASYLPPSQVNDVRSMSHKFLYYAFLEARMAAYERHQQVAYQLADIFHNVPLQMLSALEDRRTHEEILEDVRSRAARWRMEDWVEAALSNDNRQ